MPRTIDDIETELASVRELAGQYITRRTALTKELFAAKMILCFTEHPELMNVSWAQYTPYFNDGSECYFSVNDAYINGTDEYGDDNSEYDETLETASTGARQAVYAVLGDFDHEEFKEIFGDHVKVVVTRDGVSVQPYDHD